MQHADDCLRSGDLDGARAALVEHVRVHPADPGGRMFLFQLLAVVGEWDKAKTHLAALAKLSPQAQMLAVVYHQAMEAEVTRANVFAGRERAAILRGAWAEGIAEALQHYAMGDGTKGDEARDRAFDNAPDTPGEIDGARFEWIADADTRFGPSFEAIVQGRYGLIAFSEIERIESEGPKDLRDTVWYPVQLALRDGQSVAALLPARYPGSEEAHDAKARLGQMTSWSEGPSGAVGMGQHLFTLSTGEERGLLTIRSLVFD